MSDRHRWRTEDVSLHGHRPWGRARYRGRRCVGTEQTSQDTAAVAREVHAHVQQASISEALAFGGTYQSMLLKERCILLQM